jgi:hypothetical protein
MVLFVGPFCLLELIEAEVQRDDCVEVDDTFSSCSEWFRLLLCCGSLELFTSFSVSELFSSLHCPTVLSKDFETAVKATD